MNAAFCDYHVRHCPPSKQLLDECKIVSHHGPKGWLQPCPAGTCLPHWALALVIHTHCSIFTGSQVFQMYIEATAEARKVEEGLACKDFDVSAERGETISPFATTNVPSCASHEPAGNVLLIWAHLQPIILLLLLMQVRCPEWQKKLECDNNRNFMEENCKKSCNLCATTVPASELAPITSELESNLIALEKKLGEGSQAAGKVDPDTKAKEVCASSSRYASCIPAFILTFIHEIMFPSCMYRLSKQPR